MRVHFICYGDARYRSCQDALLADVRAMNVFDTVFGYTREWLVTTPFYENNREVLDMPRGGGYWAWKPHIILDALERCAPGDIVMYIDAGDRFRMTHGLREAIIASVDKVPLGFRMQGEPQWKMTKRDCFHFMKCDTEQYWHTPQVEAGLVVAANNWDAFDLLKLWRYWCTDQRVVTDAPNVCGLPNFPCFLDHRHDQSIITNLLVMANCPTNRHLHVFIDGNARQPVGG